MINNIAALTAEKLFNLLKKDFTDYINYKLDAGMNIDSHMWKTSLMSCFQM